MAKKKRKKSVEKVKIGNNVVYLYQLTRAKPLYKAFGTDSGIAVNLKSGSTSNFYGPQEECENALKIIKEYCDNECGSV